MSPKTSQDLLDEITRLRERLAESEETLRAIRQGEVDALVVAGPYGDHIFTLKGAESPYRLLVEQMSEGALSVNTTGLILYSNRRFADLVRLPLEQVIGTPIQQFIDEADLPRYEALARDALQASARGELCLKPAFGPSVPIYLSASGLPGDELPDLCLVVTDLTDQKRNEEMVAAERLAQSILEQAAEAIVVTDSQAKIVRANRAAHRLAGQNVLLRNFHEMFPLDCDARLPILAAARTETIHGVQAQMRRDAATLSVVVGAGALYDAAGECVGCVVTLADISEIKRVEEELRQTQKLESLGLLAGGVAHDFNNLLVGIMGNASLALETIAEGDPAKAMLKDVVSASDTAAKLTQQLLAYAGKGRFLVEPVDLSALVRQVSALVQASIPKGVQLHLHLADALPPIEVDTSQLQQLIMNFVINGAEAIGLDRVGTVLVTTGVQNVREGHSIKTVTPANLDPGRYVTLEVQDTGVGMDEATMEKIFDPFFTTKFTGRGLGLAAALGIVRGHRGALEISSVPGHGTTFKVYFPVAQVEPKQEPRNHVVSSTAEETILVIDDEAVVRRTAKAMLERSGYQVIVAENGQEGLSLYRILAEKIGLVLLDMTMPLMSGEEVFRELKTIHPDVKVILSSGYNEVEVTRKFAGKGLAGFVQKPYSAATLARKIQAALSET